MCSLVFPRAEVKCLRRNKIWRKRVGVEFAMFLQIASVYAALQPTHLRQPVLCSTFGASSLPSGQRKWGTPLMAGNSHENSHGSLGPTSCSTLTNGAFY